MLYHDWYPQETYNYVRYQPGVAGFVNETVPDSLMREARAALETIKDQIPNEVFK